MSKMFLSLLHVFLVSVLAVGCMPFTALANTEDEVQDSAPSSSESIDAVGGHWRGCGSATLGRRC